MDAIGASSPGTRLRAARERRGITQVQLRLAARVTQSSISEFETGKNTNMDALAMARICRVLGVTVEHIAFGTAADADAEELAARLLHASPEARVMAMAALRAMLPLGASPGKQAGSRS